MTDATNWMSTKEASRYLGVNLRTLYRFIDEGELPAYKFGRVIRLLESDLDAFIESYLLAAAGGNLKKGGVAEDADTP